MAIALETERVLLGGLAFPEAPRWHDGELWFSDMAARKVMRVGLDGAVSTVVEVPGQPSGLGWLPDGRLLVVSMTDRRLLRLDAEGLAVVADLSTWAPFHCNDMVVDEKGRAYVGNFGFDPAAEAEARPTVLLLVTPEGEVGVVADDLWFPNGSVITLDGRTLIVAESIGRRLSAFAIAPDGSLSHRRVWAELGAADPDGICLDAESAVWVASPERREVLRVREGGEVTHRVAAEGQAIACALGGPDCRTLFVLSGQIIPEREKSCALRGGRIETVHVDVAGAACTVLSTG